VLTGAEVGFDCLSISAVGEAVAARNSDAAERKRVENCIVID